MYCYKKYKDKPRSFFDNIDKWAKDEGASGLAYFTIEKDEKFCKRTYWKIFFKRVH